MHRALVVLHRWLALTTGIAVVVVAASGAAISFEGAIRDAHAVHVAPGRSAMSLDSLVALASASVGGGTAGAVFFGGRPDVAWAIQIGAGESQRAVTVNPYTGKLLPAPPGPGRIETTVRWMHQLHDSLLAGRSGAMVVAFVALASLVLVITGLIIWWRDTLWRIHWSASWKRIVFDLHHALGLFAAVVLLAICGTGVSMGYSRQINPLLHKFDRVPEATTPVPAAPPAPGTTPISLDSVMQLARAAVPGAPPTVMQLPANGPALVALRYPEDHTPAGRSRVLVDRYRGTVLQAASTRTAGAATRLINLERPLHTGEIFGAFTQVVWLLASLVLATQAVTGTLMWWNGRPGRRARDAT